MHQPNFLFIVSFLQLLALCEASSPQASNSQDLVSPLNLTDPPFPPASLNASVARRYAVPDTQLAIDFWHQAPSIHREDVLMCLVEALSKKVFGKFPSDPIPGFDTFFYKRNAFIHVQDLNPTVGRPHTYQDLTSTLRGVGEYMTEYNAFWTSEFQVWDVRSLPEVKIGSGGVGRGGAAAAADAPSVGPSAGTEIPACNRGNRHCVS